jgi:hypothetical protein
LNVTFDSFTRVEIESLAFRVLSGCGTVEELALEIYQMQMSDICNWNLRNKEMSQVLVVHIYNPSYLRG